MREYALLIKQYLLNSHISTSTKYRYTSSEACQGACDFSNIETWAVIKFFFLQGKASKGIHAILTETLACFLPGRAKDLSAPLYMDYKMSW